MYKTITLERADGTSQPFNFLACGTTSLRYKMTFGTELMSAISGVIDSLNDDTFRLILAAQKKAEEEGSDGVNLDELDPATLKAFIKIAGSGDLDAISKLAYIMNQQAEGANMRELNLDSYLDWLDQFESLEFLTKAPDIIGLYLTNKQGTSALKKSPAQLTGKQTRRSICSAQSSWASQ